MNDYAWWIGQDNNVWANVNGNVQKLSNAFQRADGNVQGIGNLGHQLQSGIIKLYAGNQIADPNAPASNPTDTVDENRYTGNGNGTSGSSAADAAKDNQMRSIYDRQIADIDNNISSQDAQLNNDLAALKGEFDTYKNEQESQYNANKNEYDTSTKQNKQSLQTNRNKITNRASAGLRGLLRVLGAMGAGNSSVARYNAPDMVRRQANEEYDSAGQVFSQNQQNLDTDWGNYQNQFENDKKKLEDWYNGQVKAKKQENYEKRQSLLADLVTALGNRAQYGGDYSGRVADAYNSIADYRNKITDLGQYTKPNYTGTTATYESPDLASYNANNTNLTTSVTETAPGSSPVLTALRGLKKKNNNSPYANTEA